MNSPLRDLKILHSPNFSSPRRRSNYLNVVSKRIHTYQHTIRMLQQKNIRFIKKIATLKQMMQHIKKKGLISESGVEHMLVCEN